MLDVGCGSGVLSVVAARLGAPYVEAIDISPAAVEATAANAERNGVAGAISVSSRPLAGDRRAVRLVLANLLAPVARRPGARAAPRGRRRQARSIVSGVLDGAYDHVREALAPMQVVETVDAGGLGGAARPPLRDVARRSQTARARTPIGAIRR